MTAFDSDVMSDVIRGDPTTLAQLVAIPLTEQCIPIVVCEEPVRGWLNLIKLAAAGRTKISLEVAYHRLDDATGVLLSLRRIHYNSAADQLFTKWRAASARKTFASLPSASPTTRLW